MIDVGEVSLVVSHRGTDGGVVAVHETGTDSAIWDPLAGALAGELTRYDRRGWGASELPAGYARTTVEEHSGDLTAVIDDFDSAPLVCGAGFGAVVALDLAVRRPEYLRAAILVEPPLLSFVPDATEGISADREELTAAAHTGGIQGAVTLYFSGELRWLAAGVERIPRPIAKSGAEHPASLFAELGAVPAWPIPYDGLRTCKVPVLIVTGVGTPPPLLDAAEALAERVVGSERLSVEAAGLPHYDGAPELAGAISELS